MDHNFEKLLDELHRLVLIEEEARSLTGEELKRYVEIIKAIMLRYLLLLSFDLNPYHVNSYNRQTIQSMLYFSSQRIYKIMGFSKKSIKR